MSKSPTEASSKGDQKPLSLGRLLTRNLGTRILTGVLLLPIVLIALYLGGTAFSALVIFIMLVAALELNFIITRHRLQLSSLVTVVIVAALGLIRFLFSASVDSMLLVYAVIVGVGTVVLFALFFLNGERPHRLRDALIGALGTVFLAHLTYVSLDLRESPLGLLIWLLVLTGTFGMDTFSYIGGRLFGRHRLAPHISPGKTIEGAVIGGICAIILSVAFLLAANLLTVPFLIIAIGLPLADLIGDLQESWVKRLYGVKDSYISWLNIMPGHGGVMDRIDGLSVVLIYTFVVLAVSGYPL